MSATACTLSALLMFEAAASTPATQECPLTDNRCKASLYERRASTAPNAAQRAQYLYTAYRSYLFLFEKTDDPRDLCAARRSLDASLAVADQPQAQRAVSETMRQDLVTRERNAGADCKSVARRPRARKTSTPLVARRPDPAPPVPPSDPPTQVVDRGPSTTPAPADRGSSTTPSPAVEHTRTELLAVLDRRETMAEQAPDLMPVAARHMTPERPSIAARPGRGLVIAGGVTLGVGVALTAAAGVVGRQTVDTRHQIIALGNSVDGYATTDQDTQDNALRGDYGALRTRTAGLALAAGATVLLAVILTSIGGRRMARAASRTALVPAPGGLVFRARF